LNNGTHEEADRAEFDRKTVHRGVTNLEQVDLSLQSSLLVTGTIFRGAGGCAWQREGYPG